jgi:hypothetical protein
MGAIQQAKSPPIGGTFGLLNQRFFSYFRVQGFKTVSFRRQMDHCNTIGEFTFRYCRESHLFQYSRHLVRRREGSYRLGKVQIGFA